MFVLLISQDETNRFIFWEYIHDADSMARSFVKKKKKTLSVLTTFR